MRRMSMAVLVLIVGLALALGCSQPAAPPASAPPPAPAPASTSVAPSTSTTTTPATKPAATPSPTPTRAVGPSAADFYAQNNVTLICAFAAGGGTDYASRLFASYWNEVTGGAMVVKNKTGGGGLIGANFVYAAKPDGLTLGMMDVGPMSGLAVFGDPGVQYKLDKFNFIGRFAGCPFAFSVGAGQPYKSMKDLQKAKDLKIITISAGGSETIASAMIIDYFQLDAKLLPGYAGSAELGLAAAKGEGVGFAMASAAIKDCVDKGFIKPPFAVVAAQKSEWWPDTPSIPEQVNLTPDQLRILKLSESIFMGDRKPIFAPPGVPEDRIKFMRDAFDKIMAMQSFVTQCKIRWPVWIKPLSGQEQQKEIESIMAASKPDIAKFDELAKKYLK